MSPERDREVQIFADALAIPPADRPSFLAAACCGDGDLLRRVEELLQAYGSAGSFLSGQTGIPGGESAGERIGGYKLLDQIGEGGCGVVWRAEQTEPVRRRVALKIIKLGMDTREVIARFEAERQALAMMDHPNIAKILDAGATAAGRPFFVMELVRGVKVTDFCDQNRFSTHQRLGLFSQICQAVQHAHQKGIIHRDLKPSNVLVAFRDGVPVPKVIDFGIAKATDSRLTDRTLFTAVQQFIGTPAYMSPEQAEMSGIDIDTRSDIYSLGVLLYELLAGRLPFAPPSLRQASLEEVRRMVREVEPPPPSRTFSILADADQLAIARLRGTDPARLSLLLRGDLDWIVIRCLEKNRTRRYDTPSALAADIARHLANEPVLARPPSRAYRLSKLVRRNRLAFAAAAALGLTLAAGTVVSTWQAVRARRAERQASIARAKAVDERAQAEDLLAFMLGDLREQLTRVGRLDVLESVGDKARAYFASLPADEVNDATLARHAEALTQIGEIRMAQAHFADAAAAFAEAYRRAAALAARHPRDGSLLFERGQAEYWIGFVNYRRGELQAAEEWMNRYYHTALALVALDPTRPAWQGEVAYGLHNLGVVHKARGEGRRARSEVMAELAILEKLLAADPGSLDLQDRVADAHSWLGELAERRGDFNEALKQYETQAAEYERLAEADPGTVGRRYDQANAMMYEANIEMAMGRFAAADARLHQAQIWFDTLAAHDPANVHWRTASLNVRLKSALLARRRGDVSGALRAVDGLLPQLEALAATEPSDRSLALLQVNAWRLLAQLELESGRPGAEASAGKAVALGERLVQEGRAADPDVTACATAHLVAGEIARRSGAVEEARRAWLRAADLLASRAHDGPDWRLLDPAARAASLLGRTDEARGTIRQLNLIGYVPLDPWPASDPKAAASGRSE